MSGLFVALVGPSGAGKDSLIRATAERLAADRDFQVVRRFVTRAPDVHEDHHALDAATFEAMNRAGRFALTWRAHGLDYGVPAEVDAALEAGKTVMGNLSRAVVSTARTRWRNVWVVLVTARPETLAARLAARGREAQADQHRRLQRAEPELEPDAIIANDDELSAAADRLYVTLQIRRRRQA